jgi:hypothetical protein
MNGEQQNGTWQMANGKAGTPPGAVQGAALKVDSDAVLLRERLGSEGLFHPEVVHDKASADVLNDGTSVSEAQT